MVAVMPRDSHDGPLHSYEDGYGDGYSGGYNDGYDDS